MVTERRHLRYLGRLVGSIGCRTGFVNLEDHRQRLQWQPSNDDERHLRRAPSRPGSSQLHRRPRSRRTERPRRYPSSAACSMSCSNATLLRSTPRASAAHRCIGASPGGSRQAAPAARLAAHRHVTPQSTAARSTVRASASTRHAATAAQQPSSTGAHDVSDALAPFGYWLDFVAGV